ncbi:metallophosphoesterase [Microbispora sp. RL4-1S]|uniref:Metallophosphoesterase n=2 Tax=Microbispora oryzae TaxID=2806554 RepID=A0A940WJN1_9ACTN|nr:metallophosphoesterase [Microbispora oryzae]
MIPVVVIVAHYYLWRRLVRSTTRPGSVPRRVLTWALVAFGAVMAITMIGGRVGGFGLERIVAWPGYLWLAIMFYLLVFTLVMEIPRAVAGLLVRRARPAGPGESPEATRAGSRLAGAAQPSGRLAEVGGRGAGTAPAERVAPADDHPVEAGPVVDRRLFVARTAAAIVGAGALATVGYGTRMALGDPVIERVPVRLARLDPRMSGLKIAVVSDIHLGPLTGRGHTERIVRMINGLEADVVTIVGDLVDGTVAELGPLAAPLRSLESRYGAYFVTGNHEYYTPGGAQQWIDEVGSLGVRPLRNERVEIRHAGAVLDLAGVNDLNGQSSGDGPDLAKALGGRDAARPVVLLAHQPVQVTQAAANGVDLQLSGHTHGGQMAPFNLVVPLQQPVVAGLAEVPRAGGGATQVYVTRGAGFWGPPVRVGAPPEITLIELRA